MGLTVLTPAASFALTNVQTAWDELDSDAESAPPKRLQRHIDWVSAVISEDSDRVFARQVYQEKLSGNGRALLALSESPIVAVSSVTLRDMDMTDFEVVEAEASFLYRAVSWPWTIGMAGPSIRPAIAGPVPAPGMMRPDITVTYTAGYLVPDDDRILTTLSFDGTDNSINDSTGSFPLLVGPDAAHGLAGDSLTITGSIANSRRYTVVSRTPSKVVLSAVFGVPITTEAAGPSVSCRVRNLPPSLERACILELRSAWLQRNRDPYITRDHVEGRDVTLASAPSRKAALLPETNSILQRYRRVA